MTVSATTLPQLLVGVPVFVALLALGLHAIWLRAARHDLLKPVLVGLALRLTITVAVHVASLLGGGGGFYYHDDARYDGVARTISGAWLDGHLIDPGAYDYAGSATFGYPLVVAVVYTLVGQEALAAKLVNVLLSTAVVLVTGLLARRLLGERAKTAAAWLVALAPTLVWWSAPLLKEPLVTLLFTWGLLAALSLPRFASLLSLGMAIVGLVLTRLQAAAVLAGTIAILGLVAASREHRRWAAQFVAAGGVLLGAAAIGLSGHGPGRLVEDLRANGASMLDVYGSSSLSADVGRSLLGPFPWVFDATATTWNMALYPGVWLLYALCPTIAAGLWRLRARPFVLAYLLLPVVAFVVINSIFAGVAFRQRVTVEPLLLLLALAGADTWRAVARRGAVATGAVAPIALVHTGSAVAALAIAVGAAGLWRLARRLPATPNDYLAGLPAAPGLRLGIDRADAARTLRAAARRTRLRRFASSRSSS